MQINCQAALNRMLAMAFCLLQLLQLPRCRRLTLALNSVSKGVVRFMVPNNNKDTKVVPWPKVLNKVTKEALHTKVLNKD